MVAIVALVGIGIALASLNRKSNAAGSTAFKCEFDEHMPDDVRTATAIAVADPKTPIATLSQLAMTMQMAGFPKASLCLANAAYARQGMAS